jgi:hypothetical protein
VLAPLLQEKTAKFAYGKPALPCLNGKQRLFLERSLIFNSCLCDGIAHYRIWCVLNLAKDFRTVIFYNKKLKKLRDSSVSIAKKLKNKLICRFHVV